MRQPKASARIRWRQPSGQTIGAAAAAPEQQLSSGRAQGRSGRVRTGAAQRPCGARLSERPVITSQKRVKSLSTSGCGPLLTIASEEMNSPVSQSKVSARVMTPASRKRTGPCAVWIFSGSP